MNNHLAVLAAVFALAFANTAVAAGDDDDNPDWSKQQQQAGSSGIGESCRRKNDCKAGLKCVQHTCTDPHEGETCGATADCGGELKCINQTCTSGAAASTTAPAKTPAKEAEGAAAGAGENKAAPQASGGDWIHFRTDDGGTHPFIGITGPMSGFGIAGLTGGGGSNFGAVTTTVLFAFEAGIVLGGHHELALEITPFFTAMPDGGAVFEMNASYGYLIPIAEHVSWPLRFGAGIMAGPSPNAKDMAWFEARADLVGVQIDVGHVLIDLHLPSFRYFVTDNSGITSHILNWDFGLSLAYAF